MLSSSDILYGVALPFALALLILLVAWRPWKRAGGAPSHWGGPVAAGVTFATAFAALQGPAHVLKPSSAIMWLFYAGVGFTLVGLLDAICRLPQILRGILVFAAAGGAAVLLLRFNFTNQTWDMPHGVLWLSAIAAVSMLWWASFEQSAADGGMTAPLAMAGVSGITAMIIAVLVEQTTGQAIGAMAIACTVAAALAAWSRRASLARGAAIVLAGIGVTALAGGVLHLVASGAIRFDPGLRSVDTLGWPCSRHSKIASVDAGRRSTGIVVHPARSRRRPGDRASQAGCERWQRSVHAQFASPHLIPRSRLWRLASGPFFPVLREKVRMRVTCGAHVAQSPSAVALGSQSRPAGTVPQRFEITLTGYTLIRSAPGPHPHRNRNHHRINPLLGANWQGTNWMMITIRMMMMTGWFAHEKLDVYQTDWRPRRLKSRAVPSWRRFHIAFICSC